MTLKIRLMATYGFLEEARSEWRKQLDQYPNEEDGVIDKGIEVLTYINQALAKMEEVEEILNLEDGVRKGQANKYN